METTGRNGAAVAVGWRSRAVVGGVCLVGTGLGPISLVT